MQDADGDTGTATLTITINGANDGPTVTVDPGNPLGANDLVYEAGLAAGSNAASTSEFATGTFTLADPDGLDDLVSVTIDGFGAPVTFTVAQLTGATLAAADGAGDHGTLRITGYAAGVASYEYQLTEPDDGRCPGGRDRQLHGDGVRRHRHLGAGHDHHRDRRRCSECGERRQRR